MSMLVYLLASVSVSVSVAPVSELRASVSVSVAALLATEKLRASELVSANFLVLALVLELVSEELLRSGQM